MNRTQAEAFWSRVDATGDCWNWGGAKQKGGYGNVWVDGKCRLAHRVAYSLSFGLIPDGMEVCHKCDNPSCVKPAHLFTGTHKENMQDMSKKARRTMPCGERHLASRLTEDKVRDIRSSDATHASLGRLYGVRPETVAAVRKRRTWRHVT